MATIDISLLSSISPIVVFLLFFIGGWGVLSMVDPFKGKGTNFNGLLAFLVAIILSLSKSMVHFVLSTTPWLVFLVMIGFFLMFFSMMFGIKEASLANAFGTKGKGWLITLLIVVILFGLGGALGPDLLSQTVPSQGSTSTVNPSEPVFDANGNIVPAGSLQDGTNATAGGPGATATSDFGTNLTNTLFNPKVIGILFLFILSAITIILIDL